MLKICLSICLMCNVLHAQSVDFQFYGKSISEIRHNMQTPQATFHAAFLPVISFVSEPVTVCQKEEIPSFLSPGIAQWRVDDLPFFCKIEHQMGKKLPLLFKFRLGSVDYVDWLEGKGLGSY